MSVEDGDNNRHLLAHTIHSKEAALTSAMRQNDVNAAAIHEPLPPDQETARKARINNELVEVFNRPCPVGATPSMQGIGLYTHIAGPSAPSPQFPHVNYIQQASNPVFLHIGGPAGIVKGGNVLKAPISSDVKKAWKAVQQVLEKEGEHMAQTDLDIGSLKQRYGASDEKASTQSMPQPQVQQVMSHSQNTSMTGTQHTAGEDGQKNNGRRSSAGHDLARDMTMSGAEDEMPGNISMARTGNYYEAARDPRLQGRRDES